MVYNLSMIPNRTIHAISRIFPGLIGMLISFCFLFWFIPTHCSWKILLNTFTKVPIIYIACALFLSIIMNIFIDVWRTARIFDAQKVHYSWHSLFAAVQADTAMHFILPLKLGSLILYGMFIPLRSKRALQRMGSIFFIEIASVIGACLAASLAAFILLQNVIVWTCAAVILSCLYLKYHQSKNSYPMLWGSIMGITFLIIISNVLNYYFLSKGLGLPFSPLHLLLYAPLIEIAAKLPLSWNGIGIRDGLFVYFVFPGAPIETIIALTALFFLVEKCAPALVGSFCIPYAVKLFIRKNAIDPVYYFFLKQ